MQIIINVIICNDGVNHYLFSFHHSYEGKIIMWSIEHLENRIIFIQSLMPNINLIANSQNTERWFNITFQENTYNLSSKSQNTDISLIESIIIYTGSIAATEWRASYTHFKAFTISLTSFFAPTMNKEGTTFADVLKVSPIRHPAFNPLVPFPSPVWWVRYVWIFLQAVLPHECTC